MDLSHAMLGFVDEEYLGDCECRLNTHASRMSVPGTAHGLWLQYVLRHPRAMSVHDALVVMHTVPEVSQHRKIDSFNNSLKYQNRRIALLFRVIKIDTEWRRQLGLPVL